MARLLFFGKLGDAAGGRERAWPVGIDATTIDAIVKAISEGDPALGAALAEPTVRCIVNETMSSRNAAIREGDEVAFLPPVSGG